jgi:hypothetical protein
MNAPFSIPILYLVFNRPELTRQSLARLRAIRPTTLYVVADGPRATVPDDADRCAETRHIVTSGVDWPCSVHSLYRPANLGCRHSVAQAITWFFEQEPEGIILEDDCLPVPSFFTYCEAMLQRYRNDTRVFHIAGVNLLTTPFPSPDSYYFSKFPHVWGWASWRRAWNHYDVTLSSWPQFKATNLMAGICPDPREQAFYTDIFDRVHAHQIDTWDFQWFFTCWSNHALSIVPRHTLVSNSGFGPDATHTKRQNPRFADMPTTELDMTSIHHPPFIVRNGYLDSQLFESLHPAPPEAVSRVQRITRSIAARIGGPPLPVKARS